MRTFQYRRKGSKVPDGTAANAAHTLYDTLKDFQPTVAALVAFSAAGLAFVAAMAKVRFDSREAERKRAAEELALFQRLRAALMPIKQKAEKAQADIKRVQDPSEDEVDHGPMVRADRLKLPPAPPEIAEAWSRLDLFSEATIYDLAELRDRLPTLSEKIQRLGDTVFAYDEDSPSSTLEEMRADIARISLLCWHIRKDLKVSIEAARTRGFRYPRAHSHRSDSREAWED
ncbi:hypothetical protein ACNJYD_19935 [Bradyrhizobium sp. DASA03005]|uniref:hypothetical protein n=1 Tax=Bradyrhizobium sp. SPXBL-02 TaxID=3395912 RepID=UPI003F71CC49